MAIHEAVSDKPLNREGMTSSWSFESTIVPIIICFVLLAILILIYRTWRPRIDCSSFFHDVEQGLLGITCSQNQYGAESEQRGKSNTGSSVQQGPGTLDKKGSHQAYDYPKGTPGHKILPSRTQPVAPEDRKEASESVPNKTSAADKAPWKSTKDVNDAIETIPKGTSCHNIHPSTYKPSLKPPVGMNDTVKSVCGNIPLRYDTMKSRPNIDALSTFHDICPASFTSNVNLEPILEEYEGEPSLRILLGHKSVLRAMQEVDY